MIFENAKIAVIGLGQVGLQVALAFSKKYPTLGYDINATRINDLERSIDKNGEISSKDLQKTLFINYTTNKKKLSSANIFIITVPILLKKNKLDISKIVAATKIVGKFIKKNDTIIYETTVYPGFTENVCVPILEHKSGLKLNSGFFCGYSPERINTGSKKHHIHNILKIVSGSDKKTGMFIDQLYKSVIHAGTKLVSSIKIAETIKIVENAQRDVNIAFVNQMAVLLTNNEIDFEEVLEGCKTKWNFLPFNPGFVGGECLPLATVLLKQISKVKPKFLDETRKVNENIIFQTAEFLYHNLNKEYGDTKKNVLILGFSYKANSNNTNSSKVPLFYKKLTEYGLNVEIFDPLISETNIYPKFRFVDNPDNPYHLIIQLIDHQIFEKITFRNTLFFDLKNFNLKKIA